MLGADLSQFATLVGFGPQGWGGQILAGAFVTLQVSLASYAVGIALGLLGAAAKLSGSAPLKAVADLYTTFIRAVPALLLIVVMFYAGSSSFDALMDLVGMKGRIVLSGFSAVVFALGFILGAYMTEVFRGAIVALPNGVTEAARALSLSPWLRFRLVTFPLMMRIALPGLSNLWQSALKDSALASVVGFEELLGMGKIAAGQTKFYLSFYLAVAAVFLAIALVSNAGLGVFERRLNRGFR
jgi:polar amino acid transport system permease protein